MGFRIADTEDLPRLKEVYRDIVKDMDSRGICIWDEIYPCEFLQEDILKGRLYLLEENGVILSAFALCGEHDGETKVGWKDSSAKAIYLSSLSKPKRTSRPRTVTSTSCTVGRSPPTAVSSGGVNTGVSSRKLSGSNLDWI